MSFWSTVLIVLAKDLRVELRGRHALNLLVPFVGAALVIFGIGLGPGRTVLEEVAPGLLWVTVLFASLLGAGWSFGQEEEDGALRGLVLAPVDKAAVFLGKALALSMVLFLIGSVAGLLASVLFVISLPPSATIALVGFALGAIGLAALTGLFSGLVVSARAREALLPLLVLPLAVPLTLSGVRVTTLSLQAATGAAWSWLALMVAFDAVFVASGVLLFHWVLEQ